MVSEVEVNDDEDMEKMDVRSNIVGDRSNSRMFSFPLATGRHCDVRRPDCGGLTPAAITIRNGPHGDALAYPSSGHSTPITYAYYR